MPVLRETNGDSAEHPSAQASTCRSAMVAFVDDDAKELALISAAATCAADHRPSRTDASQVSRRGIGRCDRPRLLDHLDRVRV
jgi:hypothetical protein